jgi:ubiquinone/menaquinone biosynthesis C-methylase UbiE
MGRIFDIHAAEQYRTWQQSLKGKAMERWLEESVLSLLTPRPGERVLDIGCGEGNHLLLLNRLGLGISGIDASPYMINRATERLGNRCDLKIARAEDLPFEDNEFDLAVMINTAEFLEAPLEAIREAGRVARRKVFVSTLNSFSWYHLSSKVLSPFSRFPFQDTRYFNLWSLRALLQAAMGDVPITWRSGQFLSPFMWKIGPAFEGLCKRFRIPWGAFLGLSADTKYWLRTEQHPLKLTLKKTEPFIADGITRVGKNHHERNGHHAGSLSI